MKKILGTVALVAILIVAACNTSKNSMATVTPPLSPQTPAQPQKTEMTNSNTQSMPSQFEKRALPTTRLQPMQAVSMPDTTKHK